jgi:uncharacterized damage-inducible protein DinB
MERLGAPTSAPENRRGRALTLEGRDRGYSENVNGALEEAFRAHAWATQRLLESCRDLSAEQLAATNSVTGWTILQTFTHLVSADGYYVGTVSGSGRPVPRWNEDEDPAWTYDDLLERSTLLAGLWKSYLEQTDDADRLVVIDNGTFECRAGVIVAHALHHGDLHREQICSTLRGLGLEPPDLQPWEYALDTGRARFVTGANAS